MSQDRFPERIDPHRIFARNGSISSEIPVSDLARLSGYLSESGGMVKVHLDFGYDENQRRLITGTLSSCLHVQCQRCLQDMPLDVDTGLRVLVMSSEAQVRALPAEVEAVVADEDKGLDLLALVEDELILSLPIVPHHADEHCNEDLDRLNRPPEGEARASPFAKLRELKLGQGGGKGGEKGPGSGTKKPTDTD